MRLLTTSIALASLALALASAGANAQNARYVTDQLKLEARNGPGTSNRIVRMLESGTRVEVVEEREGWSRVNVPGGGEAWILSRYLDTEAPARDRLQAMTAEIERLREEIGSRNTQFNALQAENEALREDRDSFASKAETIARELAELKQTASGAVALREQNTRLAEKSATLKQNFDGLREEFLMLRDARGRDWFLAGAGVLVGGMLLGLIIPRIRWKRRRSWSEL